MRKKLTFLLIAILASLGAMAQDVVEISTVDQLKAFRDAVNSGDTYAGKTVKLTADLDLSSENNWVPIGNLVAYPGQSFNVVFDGGGHSISNLTCTDNTPQYAVAGLFGSIVSGTIKDLTVKNVNIKSTHFAGGIVAYTSKTPIIENCHVIGGTISSTPEIVDGSYDNGDKVGGIMGYATAGSTIDKCTVQDVTITAYRDIGGIVGYSVGNVTNNTVIDVTVKQDLTNGYENTAPTTIGDIVGRGSAVSSWESNNNKVLKSVAQYAEKKYVSLQAALDAAEAVDDPNIEIDLLDDVTLDITAWDGTKNPLSIGTANTQSITINGNNHSLDFVHKNSDWNNVATMNDAQTKLILNDMTITNSGHNDGPWNRHDINFNCAVELNNVTSDKALAFKNSAKLKDVTVTETGDVYSVWIQANGQTVDIDGLTATATNTNKHGRGIKVDDQYLDNPPKVTLNIANSKFTTDKKAAILLKSAGGVDVIDGGNNNIDNVAADKENLVWVDEDKAEEFYMYSLTSSTAKMVPESKESDYVARLSDANGKILGYYKGTNAIANAVGKADTGYTVTIFKAGNYAMPALPKNITVEAAENVEGVVINHTASGNVASVPNGATFKNLTFNFDNNNYHGFQHAGPINMEDCTLNGKFSSYGNMNFTNCDFNQTNSDYNMWCYDGDLTYTNCTFTNEATGKFLNLYNEGNGAHKVTVTGCIFVNKAAASNKAALNVKATCGAKLLTYDVYINNCTTKGAFPVKGDLCYDKGVETGIVVDPLAQVDDRTADGVDNIRVWKDDVQIYPLNYVAQYAGKKYVSLQAALDAAEAVDDPNIEIDLLDDVTLDITAWDGTKNPLSIGTANTQSITINGNNHKLDFVNKNSDWNNVATMNDAQTKLILNNMTITNSGHNDGPWNRHDINFNCAVELNNVTSDKALAFKNSAKLKDVTVTETRAEGSGDYCIWISPQVENQTITIDGLTATATNTNKHGRGIKVDDQYLDNPPKVTLNIANSKFTTDKKAAILLKSAGGVDVIDGGNNNIDNVAADKVNLVWVDEAKAEEFYKYSLTSSTAKMVPESKESDYVARLSDAEGKILGYYKGTNAIANAVGKAETGYTVTIFQPGSYAMPALPKNITVEAAENVEGVVFNHTASGNVASVPNGATFKNLTFNFDNNNYHGFQHAGPINMEDCTLNGKFSSYGNMNFTNCDFNQTNSDYNMWCYDGDLTYTNCTFTNEATGKFLNLYNEGNGAHKVTVTGCIFVNKAAASNKAALNVKATCGAKLLTYDVYINNCTTEGAFPVKGDLCYDKGVETGIVVDPLAQVDDRTADGVDNIRVWKDDVQIYPLNYVAQVENKKYETFAEAVTAAAGTKVIVLLKDIADTYAMTAGETLKVQKDGKAFNNPTAPADFTLKTVIDGAVTIYSVKANENLATISEGYYHIKNLGNGKYVNVKGRRTATVDANADDVNTAAGTIIKVKATNGQVEVLRSQAIDIPHYADRAMSYVHDFAKLLVEKLNASGSGEILGTTGYEAIMKKFDDNFDHHLYVEQAQGGYRIFGRTPSMKPVVEFYQENKDKVDAKLPMLEQKINDAIAKVVDKVGKGDSFKGSFELHTIWKRMNNTALTEPNDDATKLAFLQEVLSSEINVWNFAYESATFYMEKVEGSQYFNQIPADIRNYWNLAKQVHPDFKYYIVQKDGKMDFISEGNTDIINNNLRTVWALEPVTEFKVNVPKTNSKLVGKDKKEYYTTIYTDFGYQLPEGVTALKVTEIKEVKELGLAVTEEIGRKVAPQTPVLIKSETAGDITLTIDDNCGTAVTDNLLHGADWLINEYEINTPALERLFALVEGKVSESIIDKYEHLLRRNSGTVNNKYFFPISVEEDLAPAYKKKNNDQEMKDTPIRILGKKGKFLAFNDSWDDLPSNAVFLFNEDYKPVFLNLIGDVDRDGDIDLIDVNATIDIVLGRDVSAKKYDFEAADVHETFEEINLIDVNTLIDLVLNRISLKSLIEKIINQ